MTPSNGCVPRQEQKETIAVYLHELIFEMLKFSLFLYVQIARI